MNDHLDLIIENDQENADENTRLLNQENDQSPIHDQQEPTSDEMELATSDEVIKIPFHFVTLKFAVILDLLLGIIMYVLYFSLVPSTKISGSLIINMVPLDILILCFIRCYLLFFFISRPFSKVSNQNESPSKWRISLPTVLKTHIPVWICSVSLFYLLIRTIFASSTLAYLTLTFAFLFSWSEMLIYGYYIVSIGPNCWIDLEIDSILDHNIAQADAIQFEFPESPSYDMDNNRNAKSPIQLHSSGNLRDGFDDDINDNFVSMGSSAPISIVIPNRKGSMNRTSIDQHHYQRYSNSLTYSHNQNRAALSDSTLAEVCKLYLARHGDLHRICKTVSSATAFPPEEQGKQQSKPFNDAQNILEKHGRHQILPRYAILDVEIEMIIGYPANGNDLESSYHMLLTSFSSCKDVCLAMLKVNEAQSLSMALSDSTSPALFRMANASVSNSSVTDSLDFNADALLPLLELPTISAKLDFLYWLYWRLDIECVLAKTYLFIGLLHFISGRHVKGSVSLAKAHSLLNNIGQKMTLYSNNSINLSEPNNGKIGEVLYNLKNSVQETHSLILSIFFIIPSIAPNLQDTYLKPLSVLDDKWAGIRTLYQLTLKHSLESFSASLFLLFSLQAPSTGFFNLSYPAEYREISTMLSVLEASLTRHIPFLHFLVFKVYKRHGMFKSAIAKLQEILILVEGGKVEYSLSSSLVTSSALYLAVRIEMAVTDILKLDWASATLHLDSIWLILLERNRSRLTSSLDLEAGLLFVGLKKYFELLSRELGALETLPNASYQKDTLLKIGNNASGNAARFLHFTIVPSLLEKFASNRTRQSRHTQTLVHLITMSGTNTIEVFLLFLSLYYRGDMAMIASSKSNVPIMIDLALKLDSDFRDLKGASLFSKFVHSLIVGTLLKYLYLHNSELLNYFAQLYPSCQTLADIAKSIYQTCLQEQVSDWIKSLGLVNQIQFELAELEALCFENHEKSLDLLSQCSRSFVDLSRTNDGEIDDSRVNNDQEKKSPSPQLPSFLRKSQKSNSYNRMRSSLSMGSPDGVSSISSSIYIDAGEGSKMMMVESFGFESSLLGFLDFDLKCKNASKFLLRKLGTI